MNISVENLNYVWGGGVALLMLGLAASLYLLVRPGGIAGPFWARYLRSLDVWLDLIATKTTPIEVVGYQALAVFLLISGWLFLDFSLLLIAIPAVPLFAYGVLRVIYDQRCIEIGLQLDGWLLMLSNMLKATGSVGNAIQSSSDLISSPLKEEVELILKQINVGTTIEDALANMYKRAPSRGLRTVVTSLRVGRRLGGDLPNLLAENAKTLRETQRIDGFIRSQVSQGKAQMLVLGIAPLGLIYMFKSITPDFFDPLLNHVLAPYIIIGCIITWFAAMIVGFRIMNVDA